MSGKKKLLIAGGIVVVLGAVAFANLRFQRADGIVVNTEAIQKRRLEAIVSASGKIQPTKSVNISADTMGRVTNLAVAEGERVKRGQFLLQIDPRNLQTAVQRTEASLAASRSQMQQLQAQLETVRVALQQAEDNLRRQRELWKQGLTTREMLDRAEAEQRTREADLRGQELAVKTQQLRMEEVRATAESARFDLSKVRIESPIDGIVTRRNIEEGETVVVGTMNNAGTVLLEIADMSVIQAEVEVDETDIPSVSIGQTAKVTIDAMPGRTFTGKVTEIGNSPIMATGQAAGQATNFKVVVTLDQEISDVRPGFTCTAEITTATRENALAVPIQATAVREMVVDEAGAIVRPPETERRGRARTAAPGPVELAPGQSRKELEGVFVVNDGRARFVPIETGIAGDRYFEVLSGLNEGDAVIVGPFASVRELADGAAVRPEAAARSSTTRP